ncbi:hypothetical protein F0562_013507 [Nyssa sinensis]|uniref:Uncharacterized protein n=1 Tax=Nyssa sinensis TaxID=561372 RepID=A0A5J4ZQA6_9ASTE|nr:hypothetical protein F0562_013507 [Nyssa sinensis]
MATLEQQKWVAKLLGYDYKILYRLSRENSTADALSRKQADRLVSNSSPKQQSNLLKFAVVDCICVGEIEQAGVEAAGTKG